LTGVVEGAFVGRLTIKIHILAEERQPVLVELQLHLREGGRKEGKKGGEVKAVEIGKGKSEPVYL